MMPSFRKLAACWVLLLPLASQHLVGAQVAPSPSPTAQMNVVCGRNVGGNCAVKKSVANQNELYETRCCSNTNLNGFQSKCPSLGVFGSSLPASCSGKRTFASAKGFCEAAGARLCTVTELESDCVAATGCNYDHVLVWSSDVYVPRTALGVPTTGNHTVVCGDPVRVAGPPGCSKSGVFMPTLEAKDSESHEVRCCSDVALAAPLTPVKNPGCSVWAFSGAFLTPERPVNGCMWARTHWEAKAICELNNARLCTQEEVLNRCTAGAGCEFDHEWVWTSSIPTPPVHQEDLLGCYVSNNKQHLSINLGSPFSVASCYDSCFKAGYPFYGMKNGNNCFCGHTNAPEAVSDASRCTKPCVIGSGSCGGNEDVSVYKTDLVATPADFFYENKFRSCVKDTDTHLEHKLTGTYSIKGCYEACERARFSLAALANGGQCTCGDEEPLVASSDCNVPCTSGKGICGGALSTRAVSMYKTSIVKPTIKSLGLCKGQLANYWGDPHFVTFDNLKYNCQGIGHFTVTECKDYKLQTIFKAATFSPTSITHGVVAQYQAYPKVQIIIVNTTSSFSVGFDKNTCYADLYIGGVVYDPTKLALLKNTTGIDITLNLKFFEVSFPAPGPAFRTTIRFGRGCVMDVDTCLHQECIEVPTQDDECIDYTINPNRTSNVVGLLGTPNGNATDDWMYKNGTTYKGKNEFEYCTSVWCIQKASDSLFTYPPGTSFSFFDKCSVAPKSMGEVDVNAVPEDLTMMCANITESAIDMQNCITELWGAPDVLKQANGVAAAIAGNTLSTTDANDNPPPEPPVNRCPNEVILYHTNGVTPLADIGILYFNGRYLEDNVVNLQWFNFSGIKPDFVYIEYENQASAHLCDKNKTIHGPKYSFNVTCPKDQLSTMVHVTVSDSDSLQDGDTASLSECCHGKNDTNKKVKYTFIIPCVDPCPEVPTKQPTPAPTSRPTPAPTSKCPPTPAPTPKPTPGQIVAIRARVPT